MKANEFLKEATYQGSCVNSFDDDGDCVIPGLYRDVSDFAVHEEDFLSISSAKFFNHVGMINADLAKHLSNDLSYQQDLDNNIFIIYDKQTDIHYFFK